MLQKFIKTKKDQGFTLIELLIVVAIIGMLAGIVTIAVGDALARARDSRRMADVRQLATILERENAIGNVVALTGCTGVKADTTTCTNAGAILTNFSVIRNPGGHTGPTCGSVGATVACPYAISREGGAAGARTDDYRICFITETDPDGAAGPLVAHPGVNSIRTGARFMGTCP
jgi:prepilin-type N-terminal cleavage/methylation domain-containing protein